MKSCTYRGKEYPDEASFCATDGQPLRSVITPQTTQLPEEKHSVLGIASFAISIAVGGLILG